MATQSSTFLSEEEYLAIERRADRKSEYVDGEAVAMAGASFDHNLLVANCVGALWGRLRGTLCAVVPSDLKVQASTKIYYPDVTVVCGEPRFHDEARDLLLNPTLIVEVLSATTKNFDRGEKFMRYRLVESLRDYVLVAQDEIHVEHFRRQDELWVLAESRDPQGRLSIESIGCELPLEEVYDRVALASP